MAELNIEALKRLAMMAGSEPSLIGEGYDDWHHEFTELRRACLKNLPAIIAALEDREQILANAQQAADEVGKLREALKRRDV